MPKILTQQQIDQFWRDGCIFPDPRDVRGRRRGDSRAGSKHSKRRRAGRSRATCATSRTCFSRGSATSCATTTIVDAIEDLYGPNLLCWTTNFFIKEARNPAFVSWHQDSTYWGLDKPDVVTAWIALTPSNKANGAMGFIPGTHTGDQIPHRDTFAQNNLLTRGQEVAVEVDETTGGDHRARARRDVAAPRAPRARLAAESVERPAHRIRHSLHPDDGRAGRRRRQRDARARRGRHHHFEHEPRPTSDMDPAFVALHRQITERNAQILYRGTAVKSYNDPKALTRPGGMMDTGSPRQDCFSRCTEGREILVIANAWDAASARVFEHAGMRAIGTGSAGIAFSHGYPDNEHIPRDVILAATREIVRAVKVPVTADILTGLGLHGGSSRRHRQGSHRDGRGRRQHRGRHRRRRRASIDLDQQVGEDPRRVRRGEGLAACRSS